MKKIRGNKPIGIIIHTYMEICIASFISTYNFMFFILSFLFFSPTKSENRSVEQVLLRGKSLHQLGSGVVLGKGGRRVNVMQ
jgi:hypothetical protein